MALVSVSMPPSRLRAFAKLLLGLGLTGLTAPAASAEPDAPKAAALGTYVRGPASFVPGTPAALRIAAHWSTSPTASGHLAGVDVEVRLQGNSRDEVLWTGKTGSRGVGEAKFVVPSWPAGDYTVTVRSRWGERQDVSSHPVSLQPMGKLRLESDKPLYQPSQVVHLRALGLRAQDSRPLSGEKVRFEVSDPRGTRLLSVEKALSRFGIAAADLPLAEEISLGKYRARVIPLGQATGVLPAELTLEVQRYVLPRFKIAMDADRTWYGPGDTVRLTVDARYAFGKPVTDGSATMEAELKGGDVETHVARVRTVKLDADGKATFTFTVPLQARSWDESKLRVRIDITDRADHRETVVRELPVSARPVRVEVVPERGKLLQGADNTIWVVAALPDEKPAAHAEVTVSFDGSELRSRTNAIGVAELTVRPGSERGSPRGCSYIERELTVTLNYKGESSESRHCLTSERRHGIQLRTDRAIYPMGEAMALDIVAPGAKGEAYVDVLRADQTTDTLVAELHNGHGRIRVPPDSRRWGTIVLDAYVIDASGQRSHDARMVYVESPAALRVEVAAQPTYRPGESAKLRLKVVDAQTGTGQKAAVGLVMVDQALLALRPLRPAATRAFFTLAAEASKPAVTMKARPGGWTVERLVEEGSRDVLRQQAARILLAGAVPDCNSMWEIDPWVARAQAAQTQNSQLATAARTWVKDHPAGERVPSSSTQWRWREDLVARMISDGVLPTSAARDPWEQPVTTAHATQVAGLGDFSKHADGKLDQQVARIYEALSAHKSELRSDGTVKGRWPAVVVTSDDLDRWAADKLVDPWGTPFRLVRWKWPVSIGHVRSRYVVVSAGPDGLAGTPDDRYACDWFGDVAARPMEKAFSKRTERGYDRNGLLTGVAYGVGGLGLVGTGTGGGGTGEGTIGLGNFGTIGRGGGGIASKEHVRRSFPETLLWLPELETDASGVAAVDVEMADAITTWRLGAQAIAEDGRLGFATADVRVFQDFFVEVDLPAAATQHDELHLPVAVFNYLDKPQRITLAIDDAPWFTRTGKAEQHVDVAPSQVGVGYLPVRLLGVGRQKLRIRANGSAGASDVLEREIDIAPDGEEHIRSFQRRLGETPTDTTVEHKLEVPAGAIAGTSKVELKIYPSAAAHVVEGLETLLREPHGCFEQTSSTTYPNALVLDYLRRTGTPKPEIERKAREYLALGYQRLLSFEVQGGGFSLFGHAPADPILTAYGLAEFHDMARVITVDKAVIERTRTWLVGRQRPDGSFETDYDGGGSRAVRDAIRSTAYIAEALDHVGGAAKAVAAARTFVQRAATQQSLDDAYTIALVAGLSAGDHGAVSGASKLLDRLWKLRREQRDGSVSFETTGMTLMHGWGDSTEVTALAALAFIRGDATPSRSQRAIRFLLASKRPGGAWQSTQATILALKALLAEQPEQGRNKTGTVRVSVDAVEAGTVALSPQSSILEAFELARAATAGNHTVTMHWSGEGRLEYQLVQRWVEPRAAATRNGKGTSTDGAIGISTNISTSLKIGQTALEMVEVEVYPTAARSIEMPIVTVGVPPGCDVDMDELEGLVGKRGVERVERRQREVVFYFSAIEPDTFIQLPVWFKPRFPMTAQIPPARIYEYYRSDYGASAAAKMLTVRRASDAGANAASSP